LAKKKSYMLQKGRDSLAFCFRISNGMVSVMGY